MFWIASWKIGWWIFFRWRSESEKNQEITSGRGHILLSSALYVAVAGFHYSAYIFMLRFATAGRIKFSCRPSVLEFVRAFVMFLGYLWCALMDLQSPNASYFSPLCCTACTDASEELITDSLIQCQTRKQSEPAYLRQGHVVRTIFGLAAVSLMPHWKQC